MQQKHNNVESQFLWQEGILYLMKWLDTAYQDTTMIQLLAKCCIAFKNPNSQQINFKDKIYGTH